MTLKDLFERNYVKDPHPEVPEIKLPSQYKNKNYGKKRSAKQGKVVVRGGGNVYGIRHHVQ